MENTKEQLLERVETVLEQVRPYLIADGGNIEVIDIIDGNILQVRLLGACGSCPYSMQTLKAGVETAIVKEIPEIKEVVNIM